MKTFSPSLVKLLQYFADHYSVKTNTNVVFSGDQYRGPGKFDGILCPSFHGIKNLHHFLLRLGNILSSSDCEPGLFEEIAVNMSSTFNPDHGHYTILFNDYKPFEI